MMSNVKSASEDRSFENLVFKGTLQHVTQYKDKRGAIVEGGEYGWGGSF